MSPRASATIISPCGFCADTRDDHCFACGGSRLIVTRPADAAAHDALPGWWPGQPPQPAGWADCEDEQ